MSSSSDDVNRDRDEVFEDERHFTSNESAFQSDDDQSSDFACNLESLELGQKRNYYDVLTPEYVLEHDGDKLTTLEKEEIKDYPSVYYYGENAVFKSGKFDNDGLYNTLLFDQLGYRYEMGFVLGEGAFGVVIEAYDHKERQLVAIKIFRKYNNYNPYKEVLIMQYVQKINDPSCSKNFVQMREHFWFRNYLFIVFERLSMNCYKVLKTYRPEIRGFGIDITKTIVYCVIESLFVLNKHNVVHCDIKPDNMLLNPHNGSLFKLGDFGLSCFYWEIENNTHIQTLYYAAPETLYRGRITPAVDMWSVGCLVAELFTGKILFKGTDTYTQLIAIMEVVGVPPMNVIRRLPDCALEFINVNGVPKYCHFVEDGFGGIILKPIERQRASNMETNSSYALPGSIRLSEAIGATSSEYKDMVDFISRCLDWDCETRLTPAAAMHHPFLRKRVPHSPSLEKEYANFALYKLQQRRHTEVISEGRRENNKHNITNAF